MKKALILLRRKPLLTAVLALVLSYCSIQFIGSDSESVLPHLLVRVLLTTTCAGALFLISGTKTFANCDNHTGYVLRKFSGFIIFSVILGLIMLVSNIVQGNQLVAHWPIELIYNLLFVLFVGLFEELCFRAVLNDGLLYHFRENKHVFAIIAITTTLVFGWVHVASATIDSPLAFAQAALKTASTALFGLGLLVLYWKTRNLWGIALAHAMYDCLPILGAQLFTSGGSLGEYVTDKTIEAEGMVINMGFVACGWYIFQIIIALILLFAMRKVWQSIDFEKIRRTW